MIQVKCLLQSAIFSNFWFLGDLEIILLKARLEQTEKAMESIVAQMGIVFAHQTRDQTGDEDQASHLYSDCADISKEECDCETCEGKFDATYNDEDEPENICELEEEYLDEGYTNYDDDTDDDSPSE